MEVEKFCQIPYTIMFQVDSPLETFLGQNDDGELGAEKEGADNVSGRGDKRYNDSFLHVLIHSKYFGLDTFPNIPNFSYAEKLCKLLPNFILF